MTTYDFDVFIAYGSDDEGAAEDLANRLQAGGIRVFFAPWTLIPGLRQQDQPSPPMDALKKSRSCVLFTNHGLWKYPTYIREAMTDGTLSEMDLVVPVSHGVFDENSELMDWIGHRQGLDLTKPQSFRRLVEVLLPKDPEESTIFSENGAASYYLADLRFHSIRGFDQLNLDFDTTQKVIIGRNGTCKTTLLRCIALALAGDKDAPALLSSPIGPWITNGADRATIQLDLTSANGEEPIQRELEIVKDNGGESVHFKGPSPEKIFACAYGMGRGDFGGEPGRNYRVMDSVATLFEYGERLAPSELVLRRLNDYLGNERCDAILAGLKQALGLGPDHAIELPRGGGVEISGPGLATRIPLEAWADGYRMTFSWLIDFYGWAMRAGAFDDEGNVCGMLLVDEIEQHLHPSMQREILGHLEKALPKVQIITTTHSPLVALSTQSDKIIALHRNGEHINSTPVPSLDGYSAEDILMEEALFGTKPYSPATETQLSHYQVLAEIPPEDRSPEQVKELRELAQNLDPRNLPTLRNDPTLNKLDEIIARLDSEGAEE
jgi:hypothetical protein